MPGTPQQNGEAERHNSTLMDMAKSMLSNSSIPLWLGMYALRTVVYLIGFLVKQSQRLLLNYGLVGNLV